MNDFWKSCVLRCGHFISCNKKLDQVDVISRIKFVPDLHGIAICIYIFVYVYILLLCSLDPELPQFGPPAADLKESVTFNVIAEIADI